MIPETVKNTNMMTTSIETDDLNSVSFYIPTPQKMMCYSPIGISQDFQYFPRVKMRCSMNCASFGDQNIVAGFNYCQNNKYLNYENSGRISSYDSNDFKSNSSLSQTVNPSQISNMHHKIGDILSIPKSFLFKNKKIFDPNRHSSGVDSLKL